MAITIGRPPDHTFDEPLGLLSDCHRRIEYFLVSRASDGAPGIYEPHIAIEDHELFPTAARVLSVDQLREIGREMAARRSRRPANTP